MKLATLALSLLACGPSAVTPPVTTQAARHDDAWAKLSFEERHSVMTFTVLPNMARSWRDFRKTAEPEMTCRTCHGKDAEKVTYRMPNPALPAIDAAHPPTGDVARFMIQHVVPDMIELTETTPEHFGCNTCHVKKVGK